MDTQIGSLVGWRQWLMTEKEEGLTLVSLHRYSEWKPNEPLEATCWTGFTKRSTVWTNETDENGRRISRPKATCDISPGRSCTCGIYAWKDNKEYDQLLPSLSMSALFGGVVKGLIVTGVVEGWGKFAEHKNGWRTQYAKPVAFSKQISMFGPGGWRWVAEEGAKPLEHISEKFGVPLVKDIKEFMR